MEILNTFVDNSLTVQKIWDDSGNEDSRPAEIEVRLYQSTSPPDKTNAPTYLPKDKSIEDMTPVGNDFIVFDADHKWQYTWRSQQLPQTDEHGNIYYYYAVETITDEKAREHYAATYVGNLYAGVEDGKVDRSKDLHIHNTYIENVTPPIAVEKAWFDGSEKHSSDKVYAELYRTTFKTPNFQTLNWTTKDWYTEDEYGTKYNGYQAYGYGKLVDVSTSGKDISKIEVVLKTPSSNSMEENFFVGYGDSQNVMDYLLEHTGSFTQVDIGDTVLENKGKDYSLNYSGSVSVAGDTVTITPSEQGKKLFLRRAIGSADEPNSVNIFICVYYTDGTMRCSSGLDCQQRS